MHQDVLSYFWDVNFVIFSKILRRVSLHVVIANVAEILACLLTSVLGIYMSLLGTFKGMSLIEILIIFRSCSNYTLIQAFSYILCFFLILVLISEKILLH